MQHNTAPCLHSQSFGRLDWRAVLSGLLPVGWLQGQLIHKRQVDRAEISA